MHSKWLNMLGEQPPGASDRPWTRQAGVLQASRRAPLKSGQCPKVTMPSWQSPFHQRLLFPGSASDPGTTEPLPALLPSSSPCGPGQSPRHLSCHNLNQRLRPSREWTMLARTSGQGLYTPGEEGSSPHYHWRKEQSVTWTTVRNQMSTLPSPSCGWDNVVVSPPTTPHCTLVVPVTRLLER